VTSPIGPCEAEPALVTKPAAGLPATDDVFEPVPVLVERALATRLELVEARDQVSDARRSASLAKQNLLPQLDLNVGVTQLGYGASFGTSWSAGPDSTSGPTGSCCWAVRRDTRCAGSSTPMGMPRAPR